jgi:hypothetical protein
LYAEEAEKLRNYSDKQAKAEGDIATLDPQIRRLERLVENADLEGGERYLAPLFELQTKKKKIEVTVSDMELSRTRSRELLEKSREIADWKWRAIGVDFDEIWKKGGFVDKKAPGGPCCPARTCPPGSASSAHVAQFRQQSKAGLRRSCEKNERELDLRWLETKGGTEDCGRGLQEAL